METIHTPAYQEEPASDEVQEIIGHRPHLLVRQGNIIFLLVLLLLLSVAWFVRYPDIVRAPAQLRAAEAPKEVRARTAGKLARLLVHDEEAVEAGRHLAYLETTASYEEVMQLRQWIAQVLEPSAAGRFEILAALPLPPLENLGELQPAVRAFRQSLSEARQMLATGYYPKKTGALQNDLAALAALKQNTGRNCQLAEQDRDLQRKEYQAYETLAADKVIAPLELNAYKSKLLAREQSVKQLQAQLASNDMARLDKEKQILELHKNIADQKQGFQSALLELKSQVEQWIQQYVLVAPGKGRALFATSVQEQEPVNAGQPVFFIEPRQDAFYAELTVAQKGLGKIRTGQKIWITADSYPAEEYGRLEGIVSYISPLPGRNDSFTVRAALPQGLRTNEGQSLFFRNGLRAQAEICTRDRRLLASLWEE